MTKLLFLLLLRLQGTHAENPLAPAEPVLSLSLTYTRENMCMSGCMAHGKIPKGRIERSCDQCDNGNNNGNIQLKY